MVQDDQCHGKQPDAVESREMNMPEAPGFLSETQIGVQSGLSEALVTPFVPAGPGDLLLLKIRTY